MEKIKAFTNNEHKIVSFSKPNAYKNTFTTSVKLK